MTLLHLKFLIPFISILVRLVDVVVLMFIFRPLETSETAADVIAYLLHLAWFLLSFLLLRIQFQYFTNTYN